MVKIRKSAILLIIIILLALVLRVMAASNIDVKPDEMIYSLIPLNIISADRLGSVEQSIVYFYVKDLGYKLMGGVTAVSGRLPSIIFGTLTTLVIYLLSMEMFKKRKYALMSAFLFAVSGYTIRHNYEMDIMSFCLMFLSTLFLLRYLQGNQEGKDLYLCAIFAALSILTKNITLLFFPIYGLVLIPLLFTNEENDETTSRKIDKKVLKQLLIVVAIITVLISPIFIYNYFTYQQNGVTDYYFANVIGIGNSGHSNTNKAWEIGRFTNVFKEKVEDFSKLDLILFVAGVLGIFFAMRYNRKATFLVLGPPLLIAGYLAGITGSPSHYIILPMAFALFAPFSIVWIAAKVRKIATPSKIVLFILVIAAVMNVAALGDHLTTKSSIIELREYMKEELPDDGVVVLDQRIYSGIHHWIGHDKNYVDGRNFFEIITAIAEYNIVTKPTDVYFVECGKGTTCAWSTEMYEAFSQAGEAITQEFETHGTIVKTIDGKGKRHGENHTFNVHKYRMPMSAEVILQAHNSYKFWGHDIGWDDPTDMFDYYETKGVGKLVNGFGFLVLYLNVLLALLTIPFVFYLVFWKRNQQN